MEFLSESKNLFSLLYLAVFGGLIVYIMVKVERMDSQDRNNNKRPDPPK